MKVSELKNAPDWLKNATFYSEDVEIINGIVIWKDGLWEGGLWKYGTWEDGTWEVGTWGGGIWECGYKSIGRSKWRIYYNVEKKSIKIGCKKKTVEEWVEWFESNEEFETKRGTDEFELIRKSFELAKFAIELKI